MVVAGKELTLDGMNDQFKKGVLEFLHNTKNLEIKDEKGQVKVNEFLQVEGHRHLFCLGDVSNIKEGKLAVTAAGQAVAVAHNILALMKGEPLKKHVPLHPIMCIPFGPEHGITQLPTKEGVVMGSFFSKMLKSKTLLLPAMWKVLNSPFPADGHTVDYTLPEHADEVKKVSTLFNVPLDAAQDLIHHYVPSPAFTNQS